MPARRNKAWFIFGAVILAGTLAISAGCGAEKGKYLIVLQAGTETHEGTARAVHALLYSRELHEKGHEVVLLFDGAGTEWATEWNDPESGDTLRSMYEEVKELGITQGVCDFCAGAFRVKEKLNAEGVVLTSEYRGHPSVAKWVEQGYQVVVL